MNNDFKRVSATNALSTRPNFKRRKSRKGPVLLLVAIASAMTYVAVTD